MNYPVAFLFTIICSALLVACGSDPAGTGNTTANGSVSAKIGGAGWSATTVQAAWTNGVLAIGGSQINGGNNNQINITGMVSKAGTYQINPFAGFNASYTEATSQGGISAKIFSATGGTLTVDDISTAGASGSFSFDAKESQGSGTRSITEGKFNVKF